MVLTSLTLTNVRSYSKRTLSISERGMIVVGPNAIGKTNILESLFLLATGSSFRASHSFEIIRLGQEVGHIKGVVISNSDVITLQMTLTTGSIGGQKTPLKRYLVNGIPRRLLDFAGVLQVVLFHPQDLDLVTGSPSQRRVYLNSVLVQTDREYRRSLLSYEKGLRQRNRLLKKIRDEGISRAGLLFWDQLLIRTGSYISKKREEYISFLNIKQWLGDSEHLFQLVYDGSRISEARLNQYKDAEVSSAMTLVGPHRDDIQFEMSNDKFQMSNKKSVDLAGFGSRGEQRLGVLWMKLGELAYMEQINGERPVLLLDDIFSELDHPHRDIVFDLFDKQQTMVTTADPHTIPQNYRKTMEVVELG